MLKKYFAFIVAATAFSSNVMGEFDSVDIQTRFGYLKTNGDGELQFKGATLKPEIFLARSASVMQTFKLQGADVVLVSQAAGTVCPGLYAYVTVTKDGAKSTPSFGTCYDDDIMPTVVNESIAFSMKGLKGKGNTRYIYERGIVFENGKPVK